MYWSFELIKYLEEAPWPATKSELIDYAIRISAPSEVVENLQELEDGDQLYYSIEDIWPDAPSEQEYYFSDEDDE